MDQIYGYITNDSSVTGYVFPSSINGVTAEFVINGIPAHLLYEYIDGSLALRDASIQWLIDNNYLMEASIGAGLYWNSGMLDVSVEGKNYDSSLADIYNEFENIETSLGLFVAKAGDTMTGDLIVKGNVGIGTTSPEALLDISTGTAGTGATIGNAFIGVWNGNTSYATFCHKNQKGNTNNYGFLQSSGGSSWFNAAAAGQISFNIGAGGKMKLFSSGGFSIGSGFYNTDPGSNNLAVQGKIGIGTYQPAATLDVSGNVNIDSSLNVYKVITTNEGLNFTTIPEPTAPTAVLVADDISTHVTVGGHIYRVTYYTAVGETNGGTPSNTITTNASNCTVELTIPTSSDPRVIGRRIYRNKVTYVGSDVMYLLDTITNNTATTYTDIKPDAALGTDGYAVLRANTTSRFLSLNGTRAAILGFATVLGVGAAAVPTANLGRGTFIGYQAGAALTSGFANTYVGYNAGFSSTTGGSNTAVGSGAAGALTTGSGNTVMGEQANYFNQTGSNNTIIGMGALQGSYGISKSDNVVIGARAGNTNLGSGNTFIGTYANSSYYPYPSPSTGISNSIAIGYGAVNTKSNQAIFGHRNLISETLLCGKVGIEIDEPSAMLHVGGDVIIDNSLNVKGNIYADGSVGFTGDVSAGQTMRFKNGILIQVL